MIKQIKLKCTNCKTEYTEEVASNENSVEAECPKCGTFNYSQFKNSTKKTTTSKKKAELFKKGEKVKVEYIFNGAVSETSTKVIHSITKNTIYLKGTEGEKEQGVYYNLDGSERDASFYPQIYSKITKI